MNNTLGFTLTEMLVALMLFSLLSIAGYQLTSGMLRSSEAAAQHSSRLSEIQELLSLLESDIRHAHIAQKMTPPALSSFQLKGFYGATLLRLTRTVDFPSLSDVRHVTQLIEWRMTDEGLKRLVRQNAFSADAKNEFTTARVFHTVDSLSLRFYQKGLWSPVWTETGERPAAVEIRFNYPGYGNVNKIILTGDVL